MLKQHCFCGAGEGDEKGKIMGIFRSLGALSRALGPFLACTGTYYICESFHFDNSIKPSVDVSLGVGHGSFVLQMILFS